MDGTRSTGSSISETVEQGSSPIVGDHPRRTKSMSWYHNCVSGTGRFIACVVHQDMLVTGSSYGAPSEPLRIDLGWLSVKEMIVKETSTIMYKSLNDLAPKYLSDLFVRLSDFHILELRNTKRNLAVPLMRTVSGQKASSYRGTKVWNKFNNITKAAPSVYSFKSRLDSWGTKIFIFVVAYCRQLYIFLSNLFVIVY